MIQDRWRTWMTWHHVLKYVTGLKREFKQRLKEQKYYEEDHILQENFLCFNNIRLQLTA